MEADHGSIMGFSVINSSCVNREEPTFDKQHGAVPSHTVNPEHALVR